MSFYTDFQNVHLTLVKSAPKQVLPKKSTFWDLKVKNVKTAQYL
jgi:hypothetical protein